MDPAEPVIEPHRGVRRVPPLGAFLEGWRRVLHAPAVMIGMFLYVSIMSRLQATAPQLSAVWLPTFPAGWRSWLNILETQLQVLVGSVAPEVSPFFGPFFRPEAIQPGFIGDVVLNTALWMFLTGGILDRLARARPIRTAGFFGACGVFFFRFLRLAVLITIVALPLWWLQRTFPESLIIRGTALLCVAIISVLWDFAKVRAVVEDRHSMISAFAGAIRFVRRRLWRVLGLVLLNGLTVLAVLRVEFQIERTVASGLTAVALSIGWLFLAVATRLAFLSSEVVFFQGELAHAGYTAPPLTTWPDSPAVEGLKNLRARVDR
jgi:hypothetical protein